MPRPMREGIFDKPVYFSLRLAEPWEQRQMRNWLDWWGYATPLWGTAYAFGWVTSRGSERQIDN